MQNSNKKKLKNKIILTTTINKLKYTEIKLNCKKPKHEIKIQKNSTKKKKKNIQIN